MTAEELGAGVKAFGLGSVVAFGANAVIVHDPAAGSFWLMVAFASFGAMLALIGRALIRPVVDNFYYGAAIAYFFGFGCFALAAAILIP